MRYRINGFPVNEDGNRVRVKELPDIHEEFDESKLADVRIAIVEAIEEEEEEE